MAAAPRARLANIAGNGSAVFTACLPLVSRRWVSTSKDSLTKEALVEKIKASFGQDAQDQQIDIDVEKKQVSTAAGPLPLSPLFDPTWIQTRWRTRKEKAGKPMGRFRKKLANNAFARALETPLRRCANVDIILPRYFLQDFEMVKHPETGQAWWAPGPLSVELVPAPPPKQVAEGEEDDFAADLTSQESNDAQGDLATESTSTKSNEEETRPDASECRRPYRAPVTCYVLCRQSVMEHLDDPRNKKLIARLAVSRTGMAVPLEAVKCIWRQDMGGALLAMWRQTVVDALIARSCRSFDANKFIEPCLSWDQVATIHLRGCVLWLPAQGNTTHQYATFDVPDALYGRKMVVHDLWWLLGQAEVQRLRQASPMFADSELLVLKQWNSMSVQRLHLLLWRIHGYLARPEQRLQQQGVES
ncbi:hypothetical protein CDD81_6227 [Ophiocordyceps australis]|uniref:Uncharacterized protein n=1 Tax=Ophiocordyceps australis TaxID=1399860 RepID=A0A2C5Y653_9HYPO|nr:hypothetical protein CDD81_6227 [Ophiocordyceps australis]